MILGGGIWRGQWNNNQSGVRLINPSRKQSDIITIERGVAAMIYAEYAEVGEFE